MPRTFIDMMNNEVLVHFPPQRIVSVVPSQTELLFDLGLNDQVVGITKFCVHPENWFRHKTRVGGTKQLNMDKIKALHPDLVIANKEENNRDQIEALARAFPVWVSDIATVEDALRMIRQVGMLTDRTGRANDIADAVSLAFGTLKDNKTARRVAYLIWYRPWMSAGGDTFISDIIRRLGWVNVLQERQRYPEISLEELRSLNPEMVLLSSEPFPFREKHAAEIKAVLPDTEIVFADGEMFSWYGSRMQHAVPYFQGMLKG